MFTDFIITVSIYNPFLLFIYFYTGKQNIVMKKIIISTIIIPFIIIVIIITVTNSLLINVQKQKRQV